MSTKPFRIDAPGLYLTRDGRTVEVTPYEYASMLDEWKWMTPSGLVKKNGAWAAIEIPNDYDIIAKAPAPASKPRPAKGKKAKRRYRVTYLSSGWCVGDDDRKPGSRLIAQGMSRADARMFAAMKEAQRGGA